MTGTASDLLSLADAQALLLAGVTPLASEQVPLADALGRILAEDIVASRDQPPSPISAMDGYAVRRADALSGVELKVIGEAPAGAPFAGLVGPGEAVRIATGGVVPYGADHILIQENAERDGERLRVAAPNESDFIRPAGMDFAAGATVLRAGGALTSGALALAAAANAATLTVHYRPRVTILPSGDELREPGVTLGPADILNSATPAVAGLIEGWGGEGRPYPILPDGLDACLDILRPREGGGPASDSDLDPRLRGGTPLDSDVIVTLGGASVGDRDALRPAFERLGARLIFHRIAVVPGKPCWHARFPDGRLVVGLPGNPASAFVCAHLLVKPLLWALTGRDPADALRLVPAQLAKPIPANGNREAWLRARTEIDAAGRLVVTAGTRQDSGLVTPLAIANALLHRPIGAPAAAVGERVMVLPL